MNKNVFTSVVSCDFYKSYVPLFDYCVKKFMPTWDVKIFYGTAAWKTASATNLLRFLKTKKDFAGYDYVMAVDIDFLLFVDPLPWHLEKLKEYGCFAGHHGPSKKPYRPVITGSDGWRGDYERVSGGFFLMTPEWFDKTKTAVDLCRDKLLSGYYGAGFRELDEVCLARIIKESGLTVPKSKELPTKIRGIHLGDFRPDMDHRWQNMDKMSAKVDDSNLFEYLQMKIQDENWKAVYGEAIKDPMIKTVFDNLHTYFKRRGFACGE